MFFFFCPAAEHWNMQVESHASALRSFTRVSVTTHCCLAALGGSRSRRWRRKPVTGPSVSSEPEAISAGTSVASSCVHAQLGARLPSAALVHILQVKKKGEKAGVSMRMDVCKAPQVYLDAVGLQHTGLALVSRPARGARTLVGFQAGAAVNTGFWTQSWETHGKTAVTSKSQETTTDSWLLICYANNIVAVGHLCVLWTSDDTFNLMKMAC